MRRIKFSTAAKLLVPALVLTVLPALAAGLSPAAAGEIVIDDTVPQRIDLTVGKSLVVNKPPGEVSFASAAPEIVDVQLLPTKQIYLRGKAPGITSFSVLNREMVIAVFDVVVTPDITLLKEKLAEILPGEKGIRVTAAADRLTLSGTVSSAASTGPVIALAESYAPGKVINLLTVPETPDAFLLKEKIAELFPEESGVRVTAAGEKLALAGKVAEPGNRARLLQIAESYAPGRVVNFLSVDEPPEVFLLKEKLFEMLPEEGGLRVSEAGGKVTLSGRVSSTAALSRTLAIAESYAPARLINLLEVGGVHQVMLEVRVAEMNRSLSQRLGINFNYISSSGRNLGLSLLKDLTSLPSGGDGWPADPLDVGDSVNAIFTFFGFDTSWAVFIDALKENGLVHVLAEPNLITLSGQPANFLAGGEFPIPVPQGNDAITIDYKEYGVGLAFTPTVIEDGKISIQVTPEVSELDFSTAVSIGGYVVPGITTRRVSTVIELADGQSFAIAGLLQNNIRELVSKFPVLGDIPVLGALFSSKEFRKNETELIVIVTPHLVRPLDLASQSLPTDAYVQPDDFEFYLLGRLEGEERAGGTAGASRIAPREGEGGLEGDFGHIIPR